MKKTIALVTVLTTCLAATVVGSELEVMLVPIVTESGSPVPGAYGTLWTTELWVHNTTPAVMQLQPVGGGGGFPPGHVTIQDGYLGPVALDQFHPSGGGALLAIHKSYAPDVYLWNRFVELTRRADPLGVAVPVIRERDFFTAESEFLAVPAGAGVRSAIRVYNPRRLPVAPLLVDVIGESGNLLRTLTLNPGNDPVISDPNKEYVPGYDAILDVPAAVPEVRGGDVYHVRIRPQAAGTEYWAMVSVTDNETQQVLIITSHKK